MAGYAITILLSSFLLFQVQPLIGKYILPWFGGTPAVWTTCHVVVPTSVAGRLWIRPLARRAALASASGIAPPGLVGRVALYSCRSIPSDAWKPSGDDWPTLRILSLLAASIGAPVPVAFVNGPAPAELVFRGRMTADRRIGSMRCRISARSWRWSATRSSSSPPCDWDSKLGVGRSATAFSRCFAAAAPGGCSGLAVYKWRRWRLRRTVLSTKVAVKRPCRFDQLMWLALSACGSVILLATTNQMCQEVAVVPFLWVLPLALYLTTFIICFDSPRWYGRSWFGPLLVVAIAGTAAMLYAGPSAPLWTQVVVYPGAMFICCMVCHGEMVALKPDPRYLTKFYLMIAAGGALGGVLVTLAAPQVFKAYWEYHLGLIGCGLLLATCIYRDPNSRLYGGRPRRAWIGLAVVAAALITALVDQAIVDSDHVLARSRNFYGLLQVGGRTNEYGDGYYILRHGRITHGMQFLDPEKRRWPTSYYGPDTGVGLAVLWQSSPPRERLGRKEPADRRHRPRRRHHGRLRPAGRRHSLLRDQSRRDSAVRPVFPLPQGQPRPGRCRSGRRQNLDGTKPRGRAAGTIRRARGRRLQQ